MFKIPILWLTCHFFLPKNSLKFGIKQPLDNKGAKTGSSNCIFMIEYASGCLLGQFSACTLVHPKKYGQITQKIAISTL